MLIKSIYMSKLEYESDTPILTIEQLQTSEIGFSKAVTVTP